jgi:hypothetical protein
MPLPSNTSSPASCVSAGQGRAPCCVARVRHVGEVDVAHLRRDQELAVLGIDEGKLVQVALDPELRAGGGAAQHRVAHVVARRLRHAQRQVAPDPRAIGLADAGLQVERAGESAWRRPAPGVVRQLAWPSPWASALANFRLLKLALRSAVHLPLHVGAQRVEGQQPDPRTRREIRARPLIASRALPPACVKSKSSAAPRTPGVPALPSAVRLRHHFEPAGAAMASYFCSAPAALASAPAAFDQPCGA